MDAMRRIDGPSWVALSPMLDRALDLDTVARAAFVASVRLDHPTLATALENLLAAHESVLSSSFLEGRLDEGSERAGLVGHTVGAYTLDRLLGVGGMGTVWLAFRSDGRFEGRVALKLVNLAVFDVAARARFAREGTLLARLSHPNIARLFDAGVTDTGQPYLVLEYVDGAHIDAYADAHGFGVRARLELFGQVADAIAHAHANLVVHRDLKPSNILVDAAGQVKLLDFGIAKLMEDGPAPSDVATVSTIPALTPRYAAPEQVTGGVITTATDVYALGVLLYELLGGTHPTARERADPAAQLQALVDCEPHRLSDAVRMLAADEALASRITASRGTTLDRLRRMCRGDLDTVLVKALKKRPEERYSSVTALADEVRRVLRCQPIAARPDSTRYRLSKFVRRHRVPVALAGLVVMALAAGVAGTTLQGRRATHQAALAQEQRDAARAAAAEARAEAAKAQRVADLLAGVFDAASPFEHPGPIDARQLLERGSDQVIRRLEGDPAMRAGIAVVLGDVWLRLDDIPRAAALVEPAVVDLERVRGPADAETARAWVVLAKVRRSQGRNLEAQQLLERALALDRTTPEAPNRHTLLAQHIYGNLLKTKGDFEGARKAIEGSVKGFATIGDSARAEYAQAVGDLGLVLQRLNDWEGAEQAHRRSYAILMGLYGRDSPRAAVGLGNLAEVLTHFGRLSEARVALEEVIRVNRNTFGSEGFRAESVLRNSLAYVHLDAGDLAAARAEFRRAVKAAERYPGRGPVDAAWPMRGLAQVELRLGDLAAAEAIYERALAVRRRFWGAQHWEVAQSVSDLASVAGRRGNEARQQQLLREALVIRRAVHPTPHLDLARAVITLGEFLCTHDAIDEGTSLLREGLELAGAEPNQFVTEARRARAALATCEPARP
jgi:eukaryotic-like serine/threonine-protein kinase